MKIYPDELTPELRDALSTMLWTSSGIATALRADGQDIPTKAEDEQAHVIHWFINLVLEHGENWREVVGKRLKEIAMKHAPAA
jgi:hypothetical protein